jgi:transposase
VGEESIDASSTFRGRPRVPLHQTDRYAQGFDGVSGLVQECFSQDLLTGHLFLFLNRRRDRIKILYFDRDGLAIWYKRLEVGSFQNLEPTPAARQLSGAAGIELSITDLALILNGIDLATARRRKRYCRVG